MHGRRLRMHKKEQQERIKLCPSSYDLRILKTSVSQLLQGEMELWSKALEYVEGEGEIDSIGGALHITMSKHFLQWSARRVKTLHSELEALIQGKNSYKQLVQSVYDTYSIT